MFRTLTLAAFLLVSTTAMAADSSPAASSASSFTVDPITRLPDPLAPKPAPKPPVTPLPQLTSLPLFNYVPRPSDIVLGKADAPATIVEYASLSCPHCGHFFRTVMPTINKKYIETGKLRLIYRDYPLNDPALKAAELLQCADKDRKEAFLKVLFTEQAKWAADASYKNSLANYAGLGGMDRDTFDACMDNKAIEKIILEQAKEAQDRFGVNSTPTFFLNGIEIKGDKDVPTFSSAIDAVVAEKGKK